MCSTVECQREFPIIDAIPLIVPDVSQYIRDFEGPLLARADLSPFLNSVLADCLGPDSAFGNTRSILGSYAYGQYEMPAGLAALLDVAMPMLSSPPTGVWLDTGCATAGGCVDVARRGAELVLGIDVNIAMLRFARRLLRDGRARYELRKTGVVYEEREIALDDAVCDNIEVWACNATALPFYDGLFDGALSCNVVDSVDVPIFHLAEMGRVLRPNAEAVIACPYDWSTNVTALTRWIGGHSARSDSKGSSADELRRLLSDESPPEMNICLRSVRENDDVPWQVYMHARAVAHYRTHVIVARASQ